MKVLLDTHAFLALMIDAPNLSPKAITIFLASDRTLYLSKASVWEMAIKSGLNKLNLPLPVDQYITTRTQTHGITLLDITIEHMAAVENLPHHHKDPFDRLLISQCLSDKLPIMTADRMFAAYPIQTVW